MSAFDMSRRQFELAVAGIVFGVQALAVWAKEVSGVVQTRMRCPFCQWTLAVVQRVRRPTLSLFEDMAPDPSSIPIDETTCGLCKRLVRYAGEVPG